jgi:hypothetical protein
MLREAVFWMDPLSIVFRSGCDCLSMKLAAISKPWVFGILIKMVLYALPLSFSVPLDRLSRLGGGVSPVFDQCLPFLVTHPLL